MWDVLQLPEDMLPLRRPSLTLLREFDRLRKIHTMHVLSPCNTMHVVMRLTAAAPRGRCSRPPYSPQLVCLVAL